MTVAARRRALLAGISKRAERRGRTTVRGVQSRGAQWEQACQQSRVHLEVPRLYAPGVDVAVTELRAHLSDWLARAEAGEEIVVTERGIPVARLTGVSTRAVLERLTAEGVIARPQQSHRPNLVGRPGPRPRRPVAELVSEQRR